MSTAPHENPGAESTTGASGPELKRVMGPGLLLLFMLGDILGTGVYALTGKIAAEIGGAAWAPILLAFVVATVTAFSYLEMVTKYPGASGAALYSHRAFGIPFLTFMVTFTVLCSGLTSASTASRTVASNLVRGFGWQLSTQQITLLAIGFMLLIMIVNMREVSESLIVNVVLTCIELTGLVLVILVGIFAAAGGHADFSQTMVFETQGQKSLFLTLSSVTTLAFFSFVGFEDSVNMVEETKDPTKNFPRVMLGALMITGFIYVLVSILTVAIVPIGTLRESNTPLLEVVAIGAPNVPIAQIYPFLTIFAVANTALINMLMASRLLYGMAKQEILPSFLAKVSEKHHVPWASVVFTSLLGCGLIWAVGNVMGKDTAAALGGTTALLLLVVFCIVNIAVLVLRKKEPEADHEYFHAPSWVPWVGAITTGFLVGPWAQDLIEYQIALVLLGIGLVLWLINLAHLRIQGRKVPDIDVETLGDDPVI